MSHTLQAEIYARSNRLTASGFHEIRILLIEFEAFEGIARRTFTNDCMYT